jgi:long-chain acyl-CoA synthetase
MNKVVFLTGATGLIGGNLIPRILKNNGTTRLVVLIRGSSDDEAEQRLDNMLCALWPELDLGEAKKRIQVKRGDITLSRLGLSESSYATLASQVTHIIHSAASVKFQLPLECVRSVNFGGTKNVMALAGCAREAGKLRRVAYISTAYVSGDRSGIILEDDLDCRQQFTNTYEQTKLESERYVRGLRDQLPVTVFRPSIVVGDSRTGKTSAFNVLYPPLKLISRSAVRILPGSPDTPLDVVPVDYVTDAINHIFLKTDDGIGKTYHLTAGGQKATTTGEVVDLTIEHFNRAAAGKHIPPIQFVPLQAYRTLRQSSDKNGNRILQAMEPYQPYLCVRRTFDNTNTSSALRGTKITPPPFKEYYQNVLRYCIQTDWGKRLKCAA